VTVTVVVLLMYSGTEAAVTFVRSKVFVHSSWAGKRRFRDNRCYWCSGKQL